MPQLQQEAVEMEGSGPCADTYVHLALFLFLFVFVFFQSCRQPDSREVGLQSRLVRNTLVIAMFLRYFLSCHGYTGGVWCFISRQPTTNRYQVSFINAWCLILCGFRRCLVWRFRLRGFGRSTPVLFVPGFSEFGVTASFGVFDLAVQERFRG